MEAQRLHLGTGADCSSHAEQLHLPMHPTFVQLLQIWRDAGNALCDLQHPIIQLPLWPRAVGEAVVDRLRAGDGIAGQHHFHRAAHAHQMREELIVRRAHAADHRIAYLCVVSDVNQIAGRGELGAAGQAIAVHLGDDRLRKIPHAKETLDHMPCPAAVAAGRVKRTVFLIVCLEIIARREAAAGATNDGDANVRINVILLQRRVHLAAERIVERVSCLWSIERNARHAVRRLIDNDVLIFGHRFPLAVCIFTIFIMPDQRVLHRAWRLILSASVGAKRGKPVFQSGIIGAFMTVGAVRRRCHRLLPGCLALTALLLTSSCSTVQFYGQAVTGQLSILMKRKPLEDVIADPATPAAVRDKLMLAQEIRVFAEELGLPVDGAYSTYADLGRDFVVWNVFVAPEFSVRLESHCFPVAGCVTYRGYFSGEDAARVASQAQDDGKDVYVGRVAAYSTLGWFDDPVLNTFVRRSDIRFAALLFHELAHRAVYVKGDTTFNESFATAVERGALRRWLEHRGDSEAYAAWLDAERREQEVIAMIVSAREALSEVYDTGMSREDMLAAKAAVLGQLRADYAALGEGYPFAAWMALPLNNAMLGTVSAYNAWVPAFLSMLEEAGSLEDFIADVDALADLPRDARDAALASRASSRQPL